MCFSDHHRNDPFWLLRLVQLHFRVTPLGILMRIHGEEVVAVLASFDERTLARLREVRKNTGQPEDAKRSVFANWPIELRVSTGPELLS